jgi:flavin reductase (DIM6/NTAB) family NADH-FMN oxidoreductase RutF
MAILRIDPAKATTADLHQFLLGAVAPRPICFASTVSEAGVANLAPYSFFNAFSSNPPTVIFSSNRRVSNNTTKHTLENVEATKEVVINVVTHAIHRQMALTSIDFAESESEFDKAGLTPLPSELVKPYRVKESPVQMECKVNRIIPLGDTGGAGNLIFCEVLLMHIDEAILDKDGKIDPHKIDLMGRMGRAYYVRASGDAVMKVFQPVTELTIGVDSLPASVRLSRVLTGNDLGLLGGVKQLPTPEDIAAIGNTAEVKNILDAYENAEDRQFHLHNFSTVLIESGEVEEALKVLLFSAIQV